MRMRGSGAGLGACAAAALLLLQLHAAPAAAKKLSALLGEINSQLMDSMGSEMLGEYDTSDRGESWCVCGHLDF